jgi:hypothetical protein
MDTISVPVNLVSLSAAISTRVDALTPDSPPDDVLAIVDLLETLDRALDRLALALDVPVTSINTVAA